MPKRFLKTGKSVVKNRGARSSASRVRSSAAARVHPARRRDTAAAGLVDTGTGSSSRRLEWLAFAAVLLVALAIRTYALGYFPDTLLADEADNAQDAVRILYGLGPQNGIFGIDWTQQPAFSAYKQALFVSLLGFSIFALRLPSALSSALALVPFYLLLRRQFSTTASLLTTVLLATNVWYLNFSRSGWNNIDICLYGLSALLCLVLALEDLGRAESRGFRFLRYFALTGLFCALGLYGYPSGRAITLAVLGFFPVALSLYWRRRRRLAIGFLVLVVTELLVFAPQAEYLARNWQKFNTRSGVVLILNNPEYKADPAGTMWQQVVRNVRGPWAGEVNNTPQYSPAGEPQLDAVTGVLSLLGMGLALAWSKVRSRPEPWLWWFMLLAGWGSTQLLTVNTPNGARGIGYMPYLIYFASVALEAALVFARRHLAQPSLADGRSALVGQALSAAVAAVIVSAGYINVRHYVDWQSSPSTRQARYLYITEREFPEWAATIEERARQDIGTINVGQWREQHPIEDRANPYGSTQ